MECEITSDCQSCKIIKLSTCLRCRLGCLCAEQITSYYIKNNRGYDKRNNHLNGCSSWSFVEVLETLDSRIFLIAPLILRLFLAVYPHGTLITTQDNCGVVCVMCTYTTIIGKHFTSNWSFGMINLEIYSGCRGLTCISGGPSVPLIYRY